MAEIIENARMQQKHDVDENWQQIPEFVPKSGEIIIYDKDAYHRKQRIKVGDGETSIKTLDFIAGEVYAQAREPYNPGEGAIWIVPDGDIEEGLGDEQEPYTPVEVDPTLSIKGLAAESWTTGQAIKALEEKLELKIADLDFSSWEDGKFVVTFMDGSISTFLVEFNDDSSPSQIIGQNGHIMTIQW